MYIYARTCSREILFDVYKRANPFAIDRELGLPIATHAPIPIALVLIQPLVLGTRGFKDIADRRYRSSHVRKIDRTIDAFKNDRPGGAKRSCRSRDRACLSSFSTFSFFLMPRESTNTRTHFRIDDEERNKFINTINDFHPGRKVVRVD